MADYRKLLPPPLATDERFRALAGLLNDWAEIDADVVRTLAHITEADALLLQHFAEWFSLSDEPAWSFAENQAARRALAANAVMLHRRKGTPWAVRKVLELIGMGPETRLIEGGVQRVHDGTVAADGSRRYSGAAWAEYSIEADLGETVGLDSGTGARIRRVLEGIAPARCHLADVSWRAAIADSVPVSESQSADAGVFFNEGVDRPRYDGKWSHDAALDALHDGAVAANGLANYQGWRLKPAPNRYGPEDSEMSAAGVLAMDDKAGRFRVHDGTRIADGTIDFGASAPSCVDGPMPVILTRYYRHNGRRKHNGVPAGGDVTTHLEVA